MKKPAFIITETILSLILAASVAAVAVLTIDIKTNGNLLPQEIFEPIEKLTNPHPENNSTPEKTPEKNTTESKTESSQQESHAESQTASQSPSAESSTESEPESHISESESTPEPVSQIGESSEKPVSSQIEESSKTETSQNSETSEQSSQVSKVSQEVPLSEPKNLSVQPTDMTNYINSYGYDYDDLDADLDRLIIIDVQSNSKADVYCYQKNTAGYWWNIAGKDKALTDKAFIGSGGTGFDVTPDSNKTPLGFYYTGSAFYITEKPNSNYPMFQITNQTYWVTDPNSIFFNQYKEGTNSKDWSQAIHMIENKQAYQYGLVIQYNTLYPNGAYSSGIFLECGSSPTKGSIAVPADTMKMILNWLNNSQKTYIYIT